MNKKNYIIIILLISFFAGCTKFYTKKFILYETINEKTDDWIIDSKVFYADNYPSGNYALTEPDSIYSPNLSFTLPYNKRVSNPILDESSFKIVTAEINFPETGYRKSIVLTNSLNGIDNHKNRILDYYFESVTIPSHIQGIQFKVLVEIQYPDQIKQGREHEIVMNLKRYENVKRGLWIPSK